MKFVEVVVFSFIRCCPLAEMAKSTRPFCNCLHFVSPLVLIQSILLLQTNLLLLHLLLPGFLQSSSLSLTTHFKIQSNPQNTIVIPPQHMCVPSNPFAVVSQSIISSTQHIHLFFSRLFVNNFLTAHGSHH